MATHESKGVRTETKTRIVKVAHDKCSESRLDYVIFPIGFKYNEDLQSLKRGDVIRFLDGSEYSVDSIVRLRIKSAIADSLCKARYGFGIVRAVELWQERLRLRKEDIKVMSENECLIIFFKKDERFDTK